MVQELFIVYKTDNWHSYCSRELCGVFDSMDEARKQINNHLVSELGYKEFSRIKDEVRFHLDNYKQTQGLWSDGFEYDIEIVNLNEWQ